MIDQLILRLLARRGIWMTAVEIFDASTDYPLGDYVLADLKTLSANGLVLARKRTGSSLLEYGLPEWRREPAQILRDLLLTARQMLRRLLQGT
jgi:hypothetical protein